MHSSYIPTLSKPYHIGKIAKYKNRSRFSGSATRVLKWCLILHLNVHKLHLADYKVEAYCKFALISRFTSSFLKFLTKKLLYKIPAKEWLDSLAANTMNEYRLQKTRSKQQNHVASTFLRRKILPLNLPSNRTTHYCALNSPNRCFSSCNCFNT